MAEKSKEPNRPVTPSKVEPGKGPGDINHPKSGTPEGRSNEGMIEQSDAEHKSKPKGNNSAGRA